jgi:hypothetical protein
VALNHAYEQGNFESRLEHIDEDKQHDIIYMASQEIEDGFDSDNCQCRPLKMSIKTNKLEQLVSIIQAEGHYTLTQEYMDEQGVHHLLLHRQ